jgi:hypothetical protein
MPTDASRYRRGHIHAAVSPAPSCRFHRAARFDKSCRTEDRNRSRPRLLCELRRAQHAQPSRQVRSTTQW